MARRTFSGPWILEEDNGLCLQQIPLPAPASKKPSKIGLLLAEIKQRVCFILFRQTGAIMSPVEI